MGFRILPKSSGIGQAVRSAADAPELAKANELVASSPKDPTGYLRRSGLYVGVNDALAALADIDAAIGLDATNAAAHALRGMVLRMEPFVDYEESYHSFTTAIEILAEHYPVRLQSRPGDEKPPSEWRKIRDDATRDIANGKAVYASLLRRARASHELGDYAEADGDIKKAMDLDRKNPDALLLRAELSWTEFDDTGIKADVHAAYRLDPARAEGFASLAHHYCCLEPNHQDLGLKAAEKAIKIDPACAQAHYWRGEILLNMKDAIRARASFREAVSLDNSLALAHLSLAKCLEDSGQLLEAGVELESFVREADRPYAVGIVDAIERIELLRAKHDR